MPFKNKVLAGILFFILLSCQYLFSADKKDNKEKVEVDTSTVTKNDEEAEAYEEDEFPLWAKDLRRYEIISLGSMPFVGLWVVGGYGGFKYFSGKTDSFPNPFSSKDAFEKHEIWAMVGVTAGVAAGIGIADFIINLSKRKKIEKEKALQDARDREGITPLSPEEAGQLLRENSRPKVEEE